MKLNIFLPLSLVMVLSTGCVAKPLGVDSNQASPAPVVVNKMTVEPVAVSNAPKESNDYDKKLKQCVVESNYLAKKDKKKYEVTNNALVEMLSSVKSYSSQISLIDEKNKQIINSMYIYQINDLCNSISQFYLSEVKKDLDAIVNKTKRK